MGNQNKTFHVVGSVWGQGKEDTCEEQKTKSSRALKDKASQPNQSGGKRQVLGKACHVQPK